MKLVAKGCLIKVRATRFVPPFRHGSCYGFWVLTFRERSPIFRYGQYVPATTRGVDDENIMATGPRLHHTGHSTGPFGSLVLTVRSQDWCPSVVARQSERMS